MHLSIKARLAISLAAVLVPLLAFSIVSSIHSQSTVALVREIVVDPLQEMRESTRVLELAHDVEQEVNRHLLFGDSKSRAAYRDAAAKFEQALARFADGEDMLPEQQELLQQARAEWTRLRAEYDYLIARPAGGISGDAVRRLAMADARFHRLDEYLNQVHGVANNELTESVVEIGRIQNQADNYPPFVVGAGLLLVSIIAYFVVRMVMTPIQHLQQGAEAFQRGDLTYRLPETSRDELGQLMATMNEMASNLYQAQQRLIAQSSRDGLTGALNRSEFDRRLASEWERVRRHGTPLALLLLDLDHFKDVNDANGHLVGDQILIAVVQLVQEQIRRPDHFARFGGEEFAVILPETGEREALQLAERLRVAIASLATISDSGYPVMVTASIGVAVSNSADTPNDLLLQADRNLYRAKRDGRNRVCGAEPVLGLPAKANGSAASH